MRPLVYIVLGILSLAFASPDQPVVHTKSGTIYGRTRYFGDRTVDAYLGIPFAEPPIADLRFKRPVPKVPWTVPLQATSMPAACVQHSAGPFPWKDDLPGQNEDCLYLNVWVPPSTTNSSKKAVMFWIHGGGYFLGSNRMPMYDGTVLAATGDVVVVAPNYRLGVLGFYYSTRQDAPGNAAIHDVATALKWTSDHIEHFGGDSGRITVWGASVGGLVSCLLTLSPLTRTLFRDAIVESGAPVVALGDMNALNELTSQYVAVRAGCASVNFTLKEHPDDVTACMRGKNALELVAASSGSPGFTPHFGDELLPEDPVQAIKDKNFKSANLLMGNTADEGSCFLTTRNPEKFGFFGENNVPVTKSFARSFINATYADVAHVEEIVDYYVGSVPDDNGYELRLKAHTAFGDRVFLCADVYFAEKFAEAGDNEVYFFYFNHRPSSSSWAPWMGVVHYEPLKFSFGLPLWHPSEYNDEEHELSKRLIQIWTDFAKHGVPLSHWPRFSKQNPKFMYLDTRHSPHFEEIGEGPHRENCNFLRHYLGF